MLSPVDLLAVLPSKFAALAASGDRRKAAQDLARTLGATDALVFVWDHELGVALPALGFPQTLPNIATWRTLVEAAGKSGGARGHVSMPDLGLVPATAVSGECVLVLCGTENLPDRDSLLPYLSLLAAVFGPERQGVVVQGELAVARNSAREVQSLAAQLDLARRDLEHRVQERTAELQAAIRELEGFTYTVSHDLRAPLRAIVSSARILEEDYSDALPDAARELLGRQVERGVALGALIDHLLSLSRLTRSKLNRERLDISSMAREIIAALPDTGQAHTFEVEPGLVAQGDTRLVRLVIQNLLENAVKYSPGGGTITVARDSAGFFVKDQGVGFSMEHAGRLFQPFERLVRQDEFPGTGIGLANVKRIVERHGGHVWADSHPGKGSTFWFKLEP